MNSHSDAFFSIGKGHPICQDYARAGVSRQGNPYAIVCDGCSSSPDTDFGARLMTMAVQAQLAEGLLPDPARTLEMIRCNLEWHHLDQQAFDTTMLAALREKDGVRVRLWGDGVIAARRRNGQFTVHTVEHSKGAPKYLSYDLNANRLEGYLETYGNEHRLSVRETPSEKCIVQVGVPAPFEDWVFPSRDYDVVALMSDGVQSFQCRSESETSKTFLDIPVEEIVRELMAFKLMEGKFVQRRVQRFLKDCVTRRWQHVDDLSMAAIWLEDSGDLLSGASRSGEIVS